MTAQVDLVRYMHPTDELGLFELRDDSASGMPTLTGHFAVFNSWTTIHSRFEGTFLERISPGAFDKTFAENRRNMRVLFQHGKDPQIGEKVLGPIADLRSEERGAYYEVPLYDTTYNRDLLPGLADNQYGASFRFQVINENFDRNAEESEHNPDALPERTITEARVMEFGPVTFGAYLDATAGLRSATDWWLEQNLTEALRRLGEGAAALEPEPIEPVVVEIASTPPSRSTRVVDHLAPREKEAPWRL